MVIWPYLHILTTCHLHKIKLGVTSRSDCVNALKRHVWSLLLHKSIEFRLYFASIVLHYFVLIFKGSHVGSPTFDILDPGPNSLLNNTWGACCSGSHIFPICLDNLVFSEDLLSTWWSYPVIYQLSLTIFLLTSPGKQKYSPTAIIRNAKIWNIILLLSFFLT